MKKALLILMAAAMLLSLCACGQSAEYKSAASLMEAGDYEGALASLQASEEYAEMTAMVSECENGIAYAEAIALLDAGSVAEAYAIFETIPDYKDVPDYLSRQKTVEITVDNWGEYFEFKEIFAWRENGFGETEEVESVYGLFVKEEYDKLIVIDASEVTLEYGYDISYRSVNVDFENKNVEVGKKAPYMKDTRRTGTCTLSDALYITYEPQFSQTRCLFNWLNLYKDVHGAYSTIYEAISNFSVSRAAGTLTLIEP